MGDNVLVDRFQTLYHKKSKLDSTHDMTEMPEEQAWNMEIIPCSKCFSKYYDDTGRLVMTP